MDLPPGAQAPLGHQPSKLRFASSKQTQARFAAPQQSEQITVPTNPPTPAMRRPCLKQTRLKRMRLKQSLLTAAAFGCLAIAAPLAVACTIPVFRYALERWESDR